MYKAYNKNRKGDSLIEVIVSFLIVSIVGLMVVSGVVTSGKIKVVTTNQKEASLQADKNLQNSHSPVGASDIKATIYKANDTGGKGEEVPNNKNIKLLKYTGSATVNNSAVDYKYYDRATLSDDPPGGGGSGAFGLGGQWYIRFYLEEEITNELKSITSLPSENDFYVVMVYSGGFPGTSSSMETRNMNLGVFNSGGQVWNAVDNDIYFYNNDGSDPTRITGSTQVFPENDDYRIARRITTNNEIQAFDCCFNWSGATSYGIDLEILVRGDDGKWKYLTHDSGKVYRRYKVFSRRYGSGYETYNVDKVGDPFASDGLVALGTGNPDGSKNIHDYDDYTEYVYLWDKDLTANPEDGTNPGYWNEDYIRKDDIVLLQLWVNEGRTSNNFMHGGSLSSLDVSPVVRFREYLRIHDTKWYDLFSKWLKYAGEDVGVSGGFTHDHNQSGTASKYVDASSNKLEDYEQFACWDFYVYYILCQYPNPYGHDVYITDTVSPGDSSKICTDISDYYKRFVMATSGQDKCAIIMFDRLMDFLKENGVNDKLIEKDEETINRLHERYPSIY